MPGSKGDEGGKVWAEASEGKWRCRRKKAAVDLTLSLTQDQGQNQSCSSYLLPLCFICEYKGLFSHADWGKGLVLYSSKCSNSCYILSGF